MYVRILIITTKHPLRHATEADVSVAKILGQSVTKRLDHNSKKFELVYVQSGECYRKIPIILDI